MMRVFFRAAAVFAALVVPSAFAAGPLERDWTKYPAIAQVAGTPTRLFALGDIHGDYDRMVAVLRRAELIGPKLRHPGDVQWTGGNAVLVQTGDMIDKGPHPVDVLRFLAGLRESARKAGGRVVITMGNHEAEFLGGPNVDKAKDFLKDLKHNHIDSADVLQCKTDIGEFLCTLPMGAKVGDWFFSHGGNTAGMTVPQLAKALEAGVSKDGYGAKILVDPNSLLEARLGEGKVWFHPSEKTPDAPGSDAKKRSEQDVLATNAKALGVAHMVQGHQPGKVTFADGTVREKAEMFQRWGLLFLIDTGMSRGVGGSKGAILRIVNNSEVTAVCPGGLSTLLWNPAEKLDAVRAAPCKK